MSSNTTLKSNVYIKSADVLDDIDFMRQIRGEHALRLLLEYLEIDVSEAKDIGLTKEQLIELEGGSKCLINDPYGGAFGPIEVKNGQEIMEFRCIRKDCDVYEECMGLKVADVDGDLKQVTQQVEEVSEESIEESETEVIEATIVGEEVQDQLSAEVDTIMKEIMNLYTRLEVIKKELKDK